MAFSGATKKLQQVLDMADELYGRLNDLRTQLAEVRERVEDTDERVARMERTLEGQQALLEALAERQGVDVESVLTEAAIDEAEASDGSDDSPDPDAIGDDAADPTA